VFPRHAVDIAHAMGALEPAELERLGALLRRVGMGDTQDAPPLAAEAVRT